MLVALIIIVVIVAGILGIAATKPDTFRFERKITINAPAESIFQLINNFHEWTKWSPYEKIDPSMSRTYSGPDSGVGAQYAWSGNAKAGAGSMEILESTPSSKILFRLEFSKPMKALNTTEFLLEPRDGAIQTTWAMYGKCPLMMKVFHLILPMDKIMARDFDAGLANLKAAAENK